MQVFENEKSVFFDCDDTLVMWNPDGGGMSWDEEFTDALALNCPYSSKGHQFWLRPHNKHIKKLKGYKRSGWKVVVWSAGGYKWAQEVVRVLQIEEHVDLVMGKPIYCYDDLPIGEGISPRKYYQFSEKHTR